VDETVHQRALMRAAEICGGVHALAERLGVNPGVVVVWMRGSTPVPPDIFAKVSEIVMERIFDSPPSPPEDAPPTRGDADNDPKTG
jgi:hypothetical protein